MKRTTLITLKIVSLAGVMLILALAVQLLIALSIASQPNPPPCDVDCTPCTPGTSVTFQVASHPMTISVPTNEDYTGGSFNIASSSIGYNSGPLERNGDLESIWIADVSGDGANDVIVVTRCGGTGLFTSIVVLEKQNNKYITRPLPPLSPPDSVGYCGKDIIWVKNGIIHAAFPTYVAQTHLRINHQWRFEQTFNGDMPFKSEPDANAFPSGPTCFYQFDYSLFKWQAVAK